jgi:hypothetical protein
MAYNPAAYEAKRRGYMNDYASTGAMNAYTQFLSQQRGQRDFADMNKAYDKQAPQVVAGYGRRGLNSANVKSGAFQQGLQDFASDRVTNTADAQQRLNTQTAMDSLTNKQLGDRYQQSLTDLEADKTYQIEQDARELLKLRSGY